MTARARPVQTPDQRSLPLSRLRRRLAIGTALAGGTLLLAPAAPAQQLPTGGTIITGAAAITTPTSSSMDVALALPATVINWSTFSVVGVDAANKASVNFRQAVPAAADAVVINRVTGGTGSTISNGTITTTGALGKENTSVWLLNPAGVLIGGGGAVDVGSFFASTLDICTTINCSDAIGAANLRSLAAPPNPADTTGIRLTGAASANAVQMTGDAQAVTSDSLVMVGGSVQLAAGTGITSGGEVDLVAATDVQVRRAGSPLIFQINAGSRVGGTLLSAGGSVRGNTVVMAAAQPDGLVEALLSVTGTVTATGVAAGPRGVVLLGGTGLPEPGGTTPVIALAAGQGGPVGITAAARLEASAQDVIVNGTGAVTVGRDVSALRDYRVGGASVTLGTTAATVAQVAGGEVSIRSTAGAITGRGALTLRSNGAGATGAPLTLASAGALAFGADTAVIGGTAAAGGGSDVRLAEGSGSIATSLGSIAGRSLGGIPASSSTAPVPLTLYGAATIGTVAVDRGVDLTVASAGGTTGSLTLASVTTGGRPIDGGSGTLAGDDIVLGAAGSVRIGSAESLTGGVFVTARDGDVTGLANGAGGFGAATLLASVARTVAGAPVPAADGSVGVYAGRSSAGALTATGTNGLARVGTVTAGGRVTVLAQKIVAGTVQAAAASTLPGPAVADAVLHAYAHDATAGATDLSAASVSAGTGSAIRPGRDVQLIADATGGTIAAGALNADRTVTVLAGTGAAGATGIAAITGEVRAGRVGPAGAYQVTAGSVTLGAASATVEQSAAGAVTIRSTATDIAGRGTLTLQSNHDGAGAEALSLLATRAIDFAPATRLFAGTGTAAGNADLLVLEGSGAAATNFGQVRARRMASASGAAIVTVSGATTFGTVDLDRSLTLSVVDGGGQRGSLATGALTLGVHPLDDGTGAAIADSLSVTTAGDARFASVASRTGSVAITAVDGDVTGLANASGFDRLGIAAARADATAVPGIADGTVTVLAGRSAGGAQTATGSNGLALLGGVVAGGDAWVDAQAVDATALRSDRGTLLVRAGAADGAVPRSATEALALGSAVSGLGTTLDATAGSVRVGTVDAGSTAVAGITDGTAAVTAYRDVRIGTATPSSGGIATRLGDVTVASAHGDITGGGTPAFGGANLSTLDGNVSVTANAQALGPAEVGLVQLGTVLARTAEALGGSAVPPARGNVLAIGRAVEVADVATARAAGGVTVADSGGGALVLQAREGSAATDVHLTIGTASVGTTATLVAGSGSLAPAGGTNGTVVAGVVEAGRNRVVGADTALPGTITIDAAASVRADTLTSRTGSVVAAAHAGDLTGRAPGGRLTVTAARAAAASGSDLAIADGGATLSADSAVAGEGIARFGSVVAGGEVVAQAKAIDAAGQLARSDTGSVRYTAIAGDLSLGVGIAAVDVGLSAAADPDGLLGAGTVAVDTMDAGRNADVRAQGDAAVTGDVTAGTRNGVGYYHVAAGGAVTLGSDGSAAALADPDLQQAVDDIGIVAGGGITGAQGLLLRSNSLGRADGAGSDAGTRGITLDAGGALDLALPEGLSVTARDARATRLIAGSDAAPQQSVVQVRAAAGTAMVLGNVTARALRGIGAPALVHPGDVRAGSVAVADALTISAADPGFTGDRLLQIDNAASANGSVDLSASGDLRGYTLTAPSAAVPLGRYVPTAITAGGERVDVLAARALIGDVRAGAAAALTTTSGALRVGSVQTGALLPLAQSGIALSAATDLRLGSAIAARGDVTATARDGSVTGLPLPDDGTVTTSYARTARIGTGDGNTSVSALGTGAASGRVLVAAVDANSGEAPAITGPVRGSVAVSGQVLDLGSATATIGALTLAARPGGAGAVATGLSLGSGSAGTGATVTVDAGSAAPVSDANGSATIGTLTGGTNRAFGGTNAIPGDVAVTAAGNVRAGLIASGTGSISVTARDGNVTGLFDTAANGFGRTTLSAAVASTPASAPAIADGSILVGAGRTAAGVQTAIGGNGLALLASATAGGPVTIGAQAVDATQVRSSAGAVTITAFAADGAVAGSGGEALVVGQALAGVGATLDARAGSVRADLVDAGRLANSPPSDATITAARDIRLGLATARTGNVTATARDGDLTGLFDGAANAYARAVIAAAADASAYAGRSDTGARTATAANGLARLDRIAAGGSVTILAEAIDATRADAGRGTLTARAYADDGAVGGSAAESLVIASAASGLTTRLTSAGSIGSASVDAGTLAGATGNLIATAQRNVRLDRGTSGTGDIAITAVDGDATGLLSGGVAGRAVLTANRGGVDVFAGRSDTGALTATGTDGLALLDTVTAAGTIRVGAQAIDALVATATNGALVGRSYALDGAVAGSALQSLVLGTGRAGGDLTLTAAGSIRADDVTAGTLAGATGSLLIDAARNVRLATGSAATGDVSVTARDGDLTGPGGTRSRLSAAVAGIAGALADGSVEAYAGRTSAGALTATGSNGLALIDTAVAGRDVTIHAQAIDVATVQAAVAGPNARAAGGSVVVQAYGTTARAGGVDLAIGSATAGTGSSTRTGLDVQLVASAEGARLSAATLTADRDILVRAGTGAIGSAGDALVTGEVRAGGQIASGSYSVTGGTVRLGADAAAVAQTAAGGVTVTSTLADIVGLGAADPAAGGLTLRANADGVGGEPLVLSSARGIVFAPSTHLLAGDYDAAGFASGRSDIELAEGAGASVTSFGEVRGRSLGGIPAAAASAPVALTLYGATSFGTVALDRSLVLSVLDGAAPGSLASGPLSVGANPTGTADVLRVTSAGAARFATVSNTTGLVALEVTGARQTLTATGDVVGLGAVTLKAPGAVSTTAVRSDAGRVQIDSVAGDATGDSVRALGGDLLVNAGWLARYTLAEASTDATVTAGRIDLGTAITGTALTLTARAGDAADGEALVLGTGSVGTTADLAADGGSVRATTLAAGLNRNGTPGSITVGAARNVRLATGSSATGSVTVTARDGDVTGLAAAAGFGRATLTAATASAAAGGRPAVADGNVSVYAGRSATGGLTATGANGFARLATVTAGNDVTVLAQKIDAATVQAAAVPSVAAGASGTATLHAYAHDTAAGAVDLGVGSVAAGTGSATRAGRDVLLTADATDAVLLVGSIAADRSATAIAGSGANGSATITGAVAAGRRDPTGAYQVTGGNVTLGAPDTAVYQSAAAATTITATAGGVTGRGALTLRSNADGSGAEAVQVSATGGSIVFDTASTIVGGQGASGSNVTLTATGGGTGSITAGTIAAPGRTLAANATGAITTNGPATAATLTMQAGGALTTNGTLSATALALRSGAGVTVNAAANATTAALRATGLAAINGALTANTVTVQSGAVAINAALGAPGATVNLFDQAIAANPIRLGGAAVDDTGYSLSQAELGRVSAATLLIGAGADDPSGETVPSGALRQDIVIGALDLAAGTGSTAVKVLGTGTNTLSVVGAVRLLPTDGTTARTLQLGGAAANTSTEIARLQIVNASNSGSATLAIPGAAATSPASAGSITANPASTVDLRAALILAGNPGFIADVAAAGADVANRQISNPNSSLYGAGPNAYLSTPAVPLITTGRLRVQFSNLALLQNRSRTGAIASGVVITGQPSTTADAQPLVIRSTTGTQANGFALFGVFQPGGTGTRFINEQAALLGSAYISTAQGTQGSVNPSAARINGCLIASASGGCLAASIAQPSLNVFDVTRDQVLRGSDNLTVTFDPLVGSNNEALFGDIAAGDSTFTQDPCPDGTVSAQCKTTGDRP